MDGRLIGSGRACDVLAAGPDRVRRVYRTPHPGATAREFAVMRHLAAHGFPVPQVFEHTADSIVMARIEGPSMLARLAARPWTAHALADTLAELHRRLAGVGRAGLDLDAPFGQGECVAHLDLHSDNVLLSATGPVVIDWTNACLAPSGFDVAATWVVTATGEVDAPLWLRPIAGAVRARFVGRFVDAAGRSEAQRWLRAAGERRIADPNTLPSEVARVRSLIATDGDGP